MTPRELLTRAFHENAEANRRALLTGCLHSVDGAWRSCELEADLLAATPSGQELLARAEARLDPMQGTDGGATDG
jgi:hypothetical protein